jgi:hypothetical protein
MQARLASKGALLLQMGAVNNLTGFAWTTRKVANVSVTVNSFDEGELKWECYLSFPEITALHEDEYDKMDLALDAMLAQYRDRARGFLERIDNLENINA